MSGFGGFGSGGFGASQNQNQTGTGFGGFGSTTGQTGGFGSGTTGAFGAAANTTGGGSLFSNTGNTTNTGFGASAFGQNTTSSPFGQPKPAFGSATTSTGSSLFGGTTATSGSAFGSGGAFGQTGSAFGGTGTTSAFGQANKPAFGGGGGSLFNTTGSGGAFGSTAASSNTAGNAFGASGASPFTGAATNSGTGTTQFSAHTDKDGAGAGSNSYQTITAMPAYSKWSTEELRLVDYAQGRKYGNQNGQPGAFGQSTGFGGFGAATGNTTGFGGTATTTGGAFGASNTSTPFGGTQNASSGFGSGNTGSGLFGAKPAGSTLFGTPAATSAPAGGSLFGATTGSAFGGGNTTGFGGAATNTGFGQTQQPKPAFGGFGANTATSTGTTGGLFASSGNTAFGGTASNTAFGGAQQNTGGSGFSFGTNQNQQQGQTGGSLFSGFGGNNQQQQKPGGLFSSSNSGGGLFNNQPQQQQQGGGGLFANNTTSQQTSGLFGPKPAGSGLFASTGANTGGGSLFSNQQQPTQGGGLFASTNNQQQNTSLFRPAAASTGLGGGLFAPQQQQQPALGGSLFNSSQQQQQPTMGGNLFAGSQQQNQPTHLVASLTDNPYGNAQLFAGLQTPTQSVGPLATPLSSSQKTKKQAVIPHYRMMPNASSRLITPQKRPQGFGFSYSTYGTPGSAVSNASPMGLGNSLLGGSSMGRSLGKSLSTSNLRHSFTANESILQPGAFSSAVRNGSGSMKKLNINRGLSSRHSLFGTETPNNSGSILSKKVSFENGTNQSGSAAPRGQPEMSGALVRTETAGERSSTSATNGQNGASGNTGPSPTPEMSQVNGSTGKELAIVPENGSPIATRNQPRTDNDRAVLTQRDQTLGPYYTQPSIPELQAMSREQRSNITNFTVGREGSGSIVFHHVDLTTTPIEQIAGGIVVLEVRTATVYGENSPVPKPARGGGLNVPSTIVLQNSWPRAKGGRLPVHERLGIRHDKHVARLKRIQDTEFVNYNSQTGEWTFRVQHYTTYGLDYDDDDSIMTGALTVDSETPTPMPEAATNNSQRTTPVYHEGQSMLSSPESSVDDTFDFKKGKRKVFPGQFEDEGFGEDEVMDESTQEVELLDGSSQGYESEDVDANGDEDHDMAGSFPGPAENTERLDFHIPAAVSGAVKPKSILKDIHRQGTPSKSEPLVLVHDWTEQLQHTASPKKRDRNALREVQTTVQPTQIDRVGQDKASSSNAKAFGTNLDIMKSLFAAPAGRDVVKIPEVPSKQRNYTGADPLTMPFRDLTRLSWGPSGSLIYGAPGDAPRLEDGVLINFNTPLPGVHNDVRFAKFATSDLGIPNTIVEQQKCSIVSIDAGTPRARTTDQFNFSQFADATNNNTPAGQHERSVWQLASILFDSNHESLPPGLSIENVNICEMRARKDRLSDFWKKLVQLDVEAEVQSAKSPEERAFIYLSGGNIPEACAALLSGMNFHLAQMVAQIGGDENFRKAVAKQIEDWRDLNVLSEMNDHVRAIYGLLAGYTCCCEGKTGAGSENKASSFNYSSRFGLDWKRAFGLRLWYGTLELEDLAFAVSRLGTDLLTGKELAKPIPWFFDGNEELSWSDPDAESREDTLWGLLKLYADAYAEEGNTLASLQSAFAPENTSGNPMDPRLSFQLLNLLRAKGIGTFVNPEGSEKENAIANADDDRAATSAADQLALLYSSRLTSQIPSNPDALPVACWVLLHISSAPARTKLIRNVLDQHASILHPGEPDNTATLLTTSPADGGLAIPREWICTSKALHAHAVTHDPVSQARWLIEAGHNHLREAHDVLCRTIGPTAIVERDYDPLREILGALVATDIARLVDWDKGGGMYFDFVELADLEGSTRRNAGTKKAVAALVRKLAKSLEAVGGDAVVGGTLERIALEIMAEWVLEIGEREEALANSRVLRLPLSENAFLAHSKQLSLNYYRAVLTRAA